MTVRTTVICLNQQYAVRLVILSFFLEKLQYPRADKPQAEGFHAVCHMTLLSGDVVYVFSLKHQEQHDTKFLAIYILNSDFWLFNINSKENQLLNIEVLLYDQNARYTSTHQLFFKEVDSQQNLNLCELKMLQDEFGFFFRYRAFLSHFGCPRPVEALSCFKYGDVFVDVNCFSSAREVKIF